MKKNVKRIVKKEVSERERVLYTFDAKKFIIQCATTFNKHVLNINKAQIVDMTKLLNDKAMFYAYCNKSLKLLQVLACDAKAKKAQLVVNTQYDSRKKLLALVEHIALSILKMKANSIHKATKQSTKKAIKI